MARNELIEGIIQGNERGFAFLIPTEKTEDYFISHSDLKGALHKDRVLAEIISGGTERTMARVLKILERGTTEIVGTYFTSRRGGVVYPDDQKFSVNVFVPFGKGLRARAGDKVVCKILSYPHRQNPEGIVTKILGRQFDKKAEIKSILFNYKLPETFPKIVLEESEKVRKSVTKKDIINREDYRKKLTFTIDGEDARDFDDAVSIDRLENGNFRLYVHIADVSHYVKWNKEIDKEAFSRATSVYFPEKVIPMLPEKLCNGICSLVEGEDRLTLSCVMTVDKTGKVIDYKITPSVINSNARLTYNKVEKMLSGDKKLAREYGEIFDSVLAMDELADILIKRREKEGTIDLDVKESAITVDKNGDVLVEIAPKDKAHKIIEEFMILANVTVAEYMFYLELPFIYRVHEKPTEEKVKDFYDFLTGLGISARKNKEGVYPKDFQSILKKAEGEPTYTLINRVMLRSMQKAKYSENDVGHFGLSLKHYCHFTSPIRRYPDLTIHRIIKDALNGNFSKMEKYAEFVSVAAKQSSERERVAIDAERAIDEYYKMLYMSGHVGEEFEGVISGVTNFGVFVELHNAVEGLVKIDTMKLNGKRLTLDQKNYTLTDGKRTFKLGQSVKIKVVGVNLGERRAEFVLV